MNKIQFKTISIEGFRSIVQPLKFNLDRPGLNLIKGRNGAGKTSIFEALIWCLYGTNLKDTVQDRIASWEEVRPTNWQGTRVQVDLTVNDNDYQIIRHFDYRGKTYDLKGGDSLMVIKNGKQLTEDRNKVETQLTINALLGMEVKIFMNSILFGQRIAKLIEQDNSDKRKLFEQLFDVDWVNLAKAKCDSILTVLNNEISTKSSRITHVEAIVAEKKNKLESIKQFVDGWAISRDQRLQAKENYLQQYKNDLVKTNQAIGELQNHITNLNYDAAADDKLTEQFKTLDYELKKVQTKASDREKEIFLLRNRVQGYEKDLKQAEAEKERLTKKNIESTCPYCEQELKPGNKLERNHQLSVQEKENTVKEVTKNLKQAQKELKEAEARPVTITPDELVQQKYELEKQIAVMDEKYQKFISLDKKLNAAEASLSQINNTIVQTEKEVERIKQETPPPNNIPQIEHEIIAGDEEIAVLSEDLLKHQEEQEKAEWWSKKAFGAGGIKSFVFKAMLTQLNQNTRKYGNRLGVSMEFSIDLSKASKPFITRCSLGDKLNKEYSEFSGGEKQRLDIVLLFAMHDLISAGTDVNILIMDEVLENLDEEGESAVFDLIRAKAEEGKSVYVISHSAVLDNLYANTIQFDNVNGNTKVA